MDRKHIFVALLLLAVIALSLYFTLEERPIRDIEEPEAQPGAEEELQDVSFSIYNDEQKHELLLISERVDNYQSQGRMELRPVEVEVYSTETDQLLYTLDGDLGYYFSSEGYIEVMGNVKIESDSYYIESDILDYYINDNYLEGRDNVNIEGSQFNSEADRFSSDLNLKDLRLFGSDKNGFEQAEVYFEEN